MKSRELGSTGERVSVLGYGAAPLGTEYGAVEEDEGIRSVHAALDAGITFFDTAPYYGRGVSEARLGMALEGRREEAFLATKCARYGVDDFDFTAERVAASCEDSLRRLRTDRIDLFQVHDIEFGDPDRIVAETLPAVERLKEQGKIRWFGITGLPIRYLRSVAERHDVDTILSYCHGNLMVRDIVDVLVPFARERGLGLICASPMHMGMLTPGGPPPWHPAPEEIKATARRVVEACAAAGAAVTDVALRFALELEGIATTVVGMKTPEEVAANVAALEGETDPALLAEIERIVAPVLNRSWPQGRPANNP